MLNQTEKQYSYLVDKLTAMSKRFYEIESIGKDSVGGGVPGMCTFSKNLSDEKAGRELLLERQTGNLSVSLRRAARTRRNRYSIHIGNS